MRLLVFVFLEWFVDLDFELCVFFEFDKFSMGFLKMFCLCLVNMILLFENGFGLFGGCGIMVLLKVGSFLLKMFRGGLLWFCIRWMLLGKVLLVGVVGKILIEWWGF